MILNLDFKYKNLENIELEGNNVAKILADLLCGRTEGISSVKAMDWARDLYSKGEIEIDRSDINTLQKIVSDSQTLTNALKAPIILVLQSLLLKE